jgi:uncharacterized repeat protein (TIGR01451 family)
VRGLHYGRANADFPAVYYADPSRPERLSDHDAPVAFLRFPQADLGVSLLGPPVPPLAGSAATWTIRVANDGPDAAPTVALTAALPASATFRSLAAPGGWTCTTPVAGGGGGLACTAPALAAGEAATFTLELDVACGVADGTVLTTTASVAALTDDADGTDNAGSSSVAVSNPPPALSAVAATPSVLWPPNHKMVGVALSYEATDECGRPACRLSVSSNEPVQGRCDHTAPDWQVVDEHSVRLRAEDAAGGGRRVYTIEVACTDTAGSETAASTTVPVEKHRRW